jgi:hypothetical protein
VKFPTLAISSSTLGGKLRPEREEGPERDMFCGKDSGADNVDRAGAQKEIIELKAIGLDGGAFGGGVTGRGILEKGQLARAHARSCGVARTR